MPGDGDHPGPSDASSPHRTDGGPTDGNPTDGAVVRTAAEAAEDVVFSRLDRSAVADLDVTVTFEEGILEVDVYLNAPDAADADRVADDAALAARGAVDDLFAER